VLIDSGRAELVLAAHDVPPRQVAFMIRHSAGFLRVAMTGSRCNRLVLPPMCCCEPVSTTSGFCVSVDAADGISTGISARDRSRTISILADPASTREDLRRPGHVVPVRVHPRGVLGRRSCHEAAVDLTSLAGFTTRCSPVHIGQREATRRTGNGIGDRRVRQ
jgi:3,4-dihydroxy 2-butanone 4-phosphate synthase / GTP cyclohydrolase II